MNHAYPCFSACFHERAAHFLGLRRAPLRQDGLVGQVAFVAHEHHRKALHVLGALNLFTHCLRIVEAALVVDAVQNHERLAFAYPLEEFP